jgi:hypothetical protein
MTKRHAKPTSAQLVERTYRQMLQFKLTLLNQMALMRLDIATERHRDREHMKTLADHCARLLKEKETLQKQIEKMREPFKIVPGEPVYCAEITPVNVKIMNSSFEGSPGDGMPKVSSTRQIDIMPPAIPILNFEMRQYPCGCWAGGNGIQPLPDYMHSKDCHLRAPFEIPTVYGAHEKLAADVLNFGFNGTTCTLAHLHRPGIRCGVCGETPDGPMAPETTA